MSLIGLPEGSFADQEDIDYFKQGIAVGFDDDILYGWYNRIFGLDKYETEYFYLAGHQLVDEASIAFWATVSIDAAVTANASFALAAAEGTGGLLLAATGVGAPGGLVLEVGALGSVVTGTIATVVSTAAGAMSARAMVMLSSTTGKINSLPTYNSGNFRTNLKNGIGDPPSWLGTSDAHHNFPQSKRFRAFFDRVLGKNEVHNPLYGSWWQMNDHRQKAYEYNQAWDKFMEDFPNATKEQVLAKGRELATKYGYSTRY